VAGYGQSDKVRNDDIGSQLKGTKVNELVEEQGKNWATHTHIRFMAEGGGGTEVTKIVTNYKLHGMRELMRPRKDREII
jgi:hypothetical protein